MIPHFLQGNIWDVCGKNHKTQFIWNDENTVSPPILPNQQTWEHMIVSNVAEGCILFQIVTFHG